VSSALTESSNQASSNGRPIIARGGKGSASTEAQVFRSADPNASSRDVDISSAHAENVRRAEITTPGHNDLTQLSPERILRQAVTPEVPTPPDADDASTPPDIVPAREIVQGEGSVVSSNLHAQPEISTLRATPHLPQRLLRQVVTPEAPARADEEIPFIRPSRFPPPGEIVPATDIAVTNNPEVQPGINMVRATPLPLRAPVREIHRLSAGPTFASPQPGTGTSTALLQRQSVSHAAVLPSQRSVTAPTVDRTHLRRTPAPAMERQDAYESSVPMPSASSVPPEDSSSTLNIDQLADRVYHLLTDRLASERSRRGM